MPSGKKHPTAKKFSWSPKGREKIEVKHVRWKYSEDEHLAAEPVETIIRTRLGPRIFAESLQKNKPNDKRTDAAKRKEEKALSLEKKYLSSHIMAATIDGRTRVDNSFISKICPGSYVTRRCEDKIYRQSVIPMSMLERLPAETLLLVCKHLKRVDHLSLAVTSRSILYKIGLRIWTSLSKKDQLSFIRALQREHRIPGMMACAWCCKVHPPFLSLKDNAERKLVVKLNFTPPDHIPSAPNCLYTARPHSIGDCTSTWYYFSWKATAEGMTASIYYNNSSSHASTPLRPQATCSTSRDLRNQGSSTTIFW
jgi:hypothetical protein